MIGIQFWLRVPWENEAGQPTSATVVAKKLGVTTAQLNTAFEKWRQEGYPRDTFYPIPDEAPAALNIWRSNAHDQGWVMRGRTWGKSARRTGDQVLFTMELVL